jgi:AraC-like DNA-binding protein
MRFRDEIAARFGIGHVSTPEPERGFRARLEGTRAGDLTVLDIAADPLRIERTRRDVDRADPDIFTLGWVVEGSAVVAQDGREAVLGRSDLVLCDSRRPFRIHFDRGFRQLLFHFRRSHLTERLVDIERVTATRVDGGSGVASVTTALLRAIHAQAPSLAGADAVVVQHALDLVALTLGGRAAESSESRAEEILLARIRGFIDANLANEGLTPSAIAERHRISRRYLYRLFEASEESICEYIRRRRLERCRAALADPRNAERGIAEIAGGWGFGNASHFSRAFRRAFGVGPRAFRAAASTRSESDGEAGR